jgi:hypothetical protein
MQIRSSKSRRQRGLAAFAFFLSLIGGFLAPRLTAGTVGFNLTALGPNSFEYNYTFSGFDLLVNQAIDIEFDPTVDLALSNGVANSDFNLVLLQPNNPPGTFGDYRALALINNPSLAGPFSVDVSFLNGVSPPSSQPFEVEQFDGGGNFVSIVASGSTVSPEPSSGFLVASGFVIGGIFCVVLGRFRRRVGPRAALPSTI